MRQADPDPVAPADPDEAAEAPPDREVQVIPPIVVGAWQLSAGHRRRPPPTERVLDDLVDLVAAGFTTFDCADIYSGVEVLLGRLRVEVANRLGQEVAETLRFHTKLVPDRSALEEVDSAYVARIVERSLERLGVERLDLVQFAWWDYDVPGWVEAACWLDDLRREGRLAAIGVTNFDVPRLESIVNEGVPVVANQVQYSALDHRPENGMTRFSARHGIALLAYGALGGGFLSDRWLGAPDPVEEVSNRSLTKYRLIIEEYGGWEAYQALLARLRRIADAHGAGVARIAVAYVLDRPGVSSAIVGMSRPERLREVLAAASIELTPEQTDAIREAARAAPGPGGDCFGLERVKGGSHARIMKYDLNRDPTA